MQRDLDRLWKRKRQIKRLLAVLSLTIVAALLVVGVRTCSEHFQEPYNRDYRPMDNISQKAMESER